MGGRQSINLCVHILGPHEAGAGWQPRQRDAGAAGTRATGGRPHRPWQRSPSSQHSVTHLPQLPFHRSCPTAPCGAPQRGAGQGREPQRAATVPAGDPRAPPEASAAPPAAQNNARPPRHSPLTWPCRLPAGAPTARGIVGSLLRDARHGKGNWPGPGHGSMASAPTRRAALRDCGMSPCSLLSPRAGFRRCAAPPPRQPRQEGARTRRAPTRSPGPRPPARPLARARAAHRRSSSWGSAPSLRGPQG